MYSVLQNKQNIQYRSDPFPYFIIDNALPKEIYNELIGSFPDYKKIIKNKKIINEYKENTDYRYDDSTYLFDHEINET